MTTKISVSWPTVDEWRVLERDQPWVTDNVSHVESFDFKI